MAPNATGDSVKQFYEHSAIYAPSEKQVMPTLIKKQSMTTVDNGSQMNGWRGNAVNGGLYGNYQLSPFSSQDPITNFGSTSTGTDGLTTISNILTLGTATIGLISAGASLFSSLGSKKQDTDFDNNLTKQQRKAIQEASRDTKAIQDDLNRTTSDIDKFIDGGSNDKDKAMQYSRTLTNYINSANARKNQLSNKAATIEKSINKKTEEYDKVNSETSELSSQLTTAKGDLETLKNKDRTNMTDEEKADLDKQIKELEGQIKQLEKKIKKNTEEVMPKIKAEIDALKTEKDTYTTQMNDIDTAVKDAGKRIEQLNEIINK